MKTVDKETGKKIAAEAALQFIKDDMIVGVGTGSTVEHFIHLLPSFSLNHISTSFICASVIRCAKFSRLLIAAAANS